MLNKHNPTPSPRMSYRHGHFRPTVVLYNTHKPLLEVAQARAGRGVIYTHKRTPKEHTKKLAYSLRFRPDEIRAILPRCLEWLVCKRPQAELMLEALEIRAKLKNVTGLSREEWHLLSDRVAQISIEIKALNRKGREGGDAI